MHSTNYLDTFIEVAEDCPVTRAEVPPQKEGSPSIARIQYDMLAGAPYQYTSDDIVFENYAEKNSIAQCEREAARADYFSKGQPCLRSSPLAKRYGWGFHHDAQGKVALYAMDSDEYRAFTQNEGITRKKALRSKKV